MTSLVAAMQEHPDVLQHVTFPLKVKLGMGRANTARCTPNSMTSHSFDFVLARWSNNNPFTTKAYYEKLLARAGPAPRAPEHPMMHQGGKAGHLSNGSIVERLHK